MKLIVLTKRKTGMSFDDYMEYYERNHAPFMVKNVPQMIKYTRKYLVPEGNERYALGEDSPIDCVTEVWFESEETFRESVKGVLEPERAAAIKADEERFLETEEIRWFRIIECETALGVPAE